MTLLLLQDMGQDGACIMGHVRQWSCTWSHAVCNS